MTLFLLITGLLTGVLLKWPFINTPLDRDYGIYGYHAFNWLKGRKTPYRDTTENHPPGRWLWYSVLLKLFPVSKSVFRWSNIVYLTLTNIVVFLIAEQVFDVGIALAAVFIFAIVSSMPVLKWVQSCDEIQQIMFTSLAMYGVLYTSTNPIIYLLIGFALFTALFFKQSAYLNAFPVILGVILLRGEYVGMGLVITGITIGYFLTYVFFKREGISTPLYRFIFALQFRALKVHMYNLISVNRKRKKSKKRPGDEDEMKDFTTESEPPDIYDDVRKTALKTWVNKLSNSFIRQTAFFLLFGLVGLVMPIFSPESTRSWLPIGIWFGFSILTLMLNRHMMPYHFFPLIPSLSILSGFGLMESIRRVVQNTGLVMGGMLFLVIGITTLWILRNDIKDWIDRERKRRGDIFGGWELSYAGEHIGKYLASVSTEDDQIYVWGEEHEIYLWAQRSSPTNTLFCPHPNLNYIPNPVAEESQRLNALKLNPPRFIVVLAPTEGFMRLVSFINRYYVPAKEMFGVHIFERKKNLPVKIQSRPFETPGLVSIIILTLNALKFTKECIESIEKFTVYPHEIIFIDNGSIDGTIDYLRQVTFSNPHYKLIVNELNRGFSGGNNQGAAVAHGDYLMFLNNDVIVSEGWLSRMVRTLTLDPSIGMVGPLTNNICGRQMIKEMQYSDREGYQWFAQAISVKNKYKRKPQRRIGGFAVLMRKNVFHDAGGFDVSYGIGNGEDIDLCLKVQKDGHKILVDESVYIHHYGSRTFAENEIDYEESLQIVGVRFKEKWGDLKQDWLLEVHETLVDINRGFIDDGDAALAAKDTDRAESYFATVLLTNPIDQEALLGLAKCSYHRQDYEKTLQYIHQLLSINPEKVETYNLAGLVSAKTGDLTNAKKLFLTALNKNPSDLEAQLNYGDVLLQAGEYETGLHILDTILKEHPADKQTLLRIARHYKEVGENENAQLFAERVLTGDPCNKQALEFVGD